MTRQTQAPPVVTDVVLLPQRADGWWASCDCGRTTRVASCEAGWEWVLAHSCRLD